MHVALLPTMRLWTWLLNCCAREEHQAQIPPALGDVQQRLPQICVLAVRWRVFVKFVDNHYHVLHAQIVLLQALPELADNSGKDQILRLRVQVRDVDDVDGPVLECAPRQVATELVRADQALVAGAEVRQAVVDLADGGVVVGFPLGAVATAPSPAAPCRTSG